MKKEGSFFFSPLSNSLRVWLTSLDLFFLRLPLRPVLSSFLPLSPFLSLSLSLPVSSLGRRKAHKVPTFSFSLVFSELPSRAVFLKTD